MGRLFGGRHVGDREFFPVVWVEWMLLRRFARRKSRAAAEFITPIRYFHGEAAAGGLQFLALRPGRPRLFTR